MYFADSFKAGMTEMKGLLKVDAGKFFTSFAGSATLGIATFFAMKKALEALSDAYNLSYDSAMKNTQANVDSFNTTKTEIKNLESEAQQYKDTLSSLSDKYEVDLSGIESIDEMITKLKQSGKLELTDEAEIAKIDSENAALERQLAIKEKLANSQQKQAASDAKDALGRGEQSVAQQVAQSVPGGQKKYQGQVNNVNVVDAVNENVLAIQEYENAIEKAEKAMTDLDPDSKAWKEQEESINSYNEAIEKLTSDLNEKESDLSSLLSAFSVGGEGLTALEGYEEEFNSVKAAIQELNNMSLSDTEKKLSNIESFFDGSDSKNTIKDKLLEIAKSGKDTDSVSDALKQMGINLETAGLDADALNQYFAEMAASANEVADATEKVNNNLTMDDIDAAFESENAGDDYVSFNDYLKQAKDLYDQGLTGTDDFKTVAEMMSYNIDSTTKSFKENYDKLKRYFKEDSDGNLTGQGIHNFLTDLQALDKGYAKFNKSTGQWEINMENTAQAAKDMKMGVGVFEAMLGRIKDYDNVGDFDFTSAVEEFESAKTSLAGLQEVYNNLGDSDRKTALGEKLKEWEPIITQAEEDLASLPDEVVTAIKFEYDAEQLRAIADEFNDAWQKGDKSAATGASRNISEENYREQRESQTGYTEDSSKAYAASYEKIAEIDKLIGQATDEDVIRDLQEKENAILKLQSTFQDALVNGTATDWEQFFNTEEAANAMHEIIESGELTQEELEDLFGVELPPQKFELEGEVNLENITNETAKLESGAILTYTAEVDGKGKKEIEALKNEDGTITYSADIDGAQVQLEPIFNVDGTISYRIASQEKPTNQSAGVSYGKIEQEPASDDTAGVAYSKKSQEEPEDKTAGVTYKIKGVIGNIKNFLGGGAGLAGTAHLSGTSTSYGRAYAVGSLHDDSWLKSHWKTKKGEYALTGEEGVEIVANGNRWWTVGDRGAEFSYIPSNSVVFNAAQSKELLTKGYINGRGKSYLGGTAYLGSASGSFSFSGGASKYNVSTKKTTNKTTSTKTTSTAKKSTKAVEKALEAISKAFDWIAVRADRLSRLSENAEAEIDRAITLADKLKASSATITAVQNELTAAEQGAARYLKEAQSVAKKVGLSTALQKKVQNGTIDITEYSDTTKEKIEAYQKYWELYLQYLDKATELEDKQNELARDRLDLIEESYDAIKGVHESIVSLNDSAIELNNADGYSAVSDAIKAIYQSSIEESQAIHDQNVAQLTAYQAEFEDLVSKGYLSKDSNEYNEALAAINEMKEAINEASIEILEFQDALRELEITRLQYLIDGAQRSYDRLENIIELAEARDEKVDESVYREQLDENNAMLEDYRAQRNELLNEQALYDVDSEKYQELAEEIAKIDDESYQLLIDNEKLKDSIYELRFSALDEGIENFQKIRSELDDFMDLMDEASFFDDNGSLTSNGLAQISLIEQAMIAAKQEIADLTTGLEKLQESFDNGVISEVEFTEKSEEYREAIVDAIKDTKSYQEALIDLYTNQLEAENDALQEIIDKRKEALEKKKSYYEYDKTISKKSSDINSLKSQIAALDGVTNASSIAQKKRLEEQLREAEEDLAETKQDHAYEILSDGYDSMSEDLDTFLDDLEQEIASNAEKQLEVIDNMLQQTVSKYADAYSAINNIIAQTGFVGSSSFNESLSQLGTESGAQSQYSQATTSQSDTSSTSTAQSTVTDRITSSVTDSFNSQYESELGQKENLDNRPVAQFSLSKTSVSLEEGKSTSVSVKDIRPTDASDKTFSWYSSDSSVATVSSGTIHAVAPGSCSITAVANSNTGLTATVSVTVTAKPTPVVTTPTTSATTTTNTTNATTASSSTGDGIPQVGDKVTYASGNYYYDSYGSRPTGNQLKGKTVYITQINKNGKKPYHISRDKAGKRPLGWLSLSQLKGYASGSYFIDKDQFAVVGEDGDELLLSTSSGTMSAALNGAVTTLNRGDKVLTNARTENIWDWSEYNPDQLLGNGLSTPIPTAKTGEMNINYHYDSMLRVDGNVDKDALPSLQEILKKSCDYTVKTIAKDARKVGFKI